MSGYVVGKISSTSFSQVIARVHEDSTFTTFCRYVALKKVTAGYRKCNPGIQEDVHFCYVYHLLPVIFSGVPACPTADIPASAGHAAHTTPGSKGRSS